MNLECHNPAALIDVLLSVLPDVGVQIHASGDAEIRRIDGRFFELDHAARRIAGPAASLEELLTRRGRPADEVLRPAVRPVRWQELYFLLRPGAEPSGPYTSADEVRAAWEAAR